jgi:hypothetical protein
MGFQDENEDEQRRETTWEYIEDIDDIGVPKVNHHPKMGFEGGRIVMSIILVWPKIGISSQFMTN